MIWPRALALVFLSAVIVSPPALASSKREQLKQTESARAEAEANVKALTEKKEAIEKEQGELKRDLVDLTGDLQRYEKQLDEVEQKQASLLEAVKEREEGIDSHREELQAMMAAAVRLSEVPPEAGLMMPEFSSQTIEAATALKLMTRSIQQKTALLKKEMKALKQDQQQAATLHERVEKKRREVMSRRKRVDEVLKQKEDLYRQVEQDQKSEEAKVKELASQSSSLKQLISSLEQALKAEKKEAPEKTSSFKKMIEGVAGVSGSKGKLRSFKRAKGEIRPPSSGRLVGQFKDSGGDEHGKGITIETAANAMVSAPYDGEVVFTGAFRNYGNLIILKHADGFHTLISGLQNIRAHQGEMLLEGEPIGSMGDRKIARKLYVELRQDNQPINPAPWFAGL